MIRLKRILLIVLALTNVGSCQSAEAVNSTDSIRISISINEIERPILEQVRKAVLPTVPDSSTLQKLMKDDLYLHKWLQANSFDPARTESKLLQHLKWREREKMDRIEMEDWSHFQTDYVIITGHKDRKGRPVAEMWLSDWNVRVAMFHGIRRPLERWILRMLESQQNQLYDARRKGHNVTHAVLLVDSAGFNFINHACGQCQAMYLNWSEEWEANYPDLFGKIVMVNVNPAFQILATTMKTVIRTSTINAFQVYRNKRTWIKDLDDMIDRNERSYRFGGNLRFNETMSSYQSIE